MNDEERKALIEEAASAWRPSSEERVSAHPAWEQLDEEGRIEAFEIASSLRQMEAALDPEGLSTAARAVMDRVGQQQRAAEAKPEVGGKLISFPRRIMQSQPLAMAAVAMLVIGIGVWVGRDRQAPGVAPSDEGKLAAAEQLKREEVDLQRTDTPPQVDEPDDVAIERVAAIEKERRRRKRGPTHAPQEPVAKEEPREEVPALAVKESTESVPERPELDALAKRSPTDTGSVKAISESEQASAVTEQERRICQARASVVEKMLRADSGYDPVPEEKLALGHCYNVLGNKAKAKEWLQRAAKHPDTKARAEKALRQLDGE